MIVDPLRTYDYLVLARERVFEKVRPLDAEQYARQFPVGLGSLARTLTHIMICEWMYMQRIQELPVPPYDQWAIQDEKPLAFAPLAATWTTQAAETRVALGRVRDWTTDLEYRVQRDDKTPMIVTASRGDIFTQLVLHEVHHRAQAMNMLRQLGATLEDIDYNALMYKRRDAPP
jgi:uncharacterized damage-inducible protein DinB